MSTAAPTGAAITGGTIVVDARTPRCASQIDAAAAASQANLFLWRDAKLMEQTVGRAPRPFDAAHARRRACAAPRR